MTVQEPNDLDAAITDENIDNFAAIVYEKSQTTPGLKQLGLLPLKDAIGYNQHKVDNLAVLLGFPKDAGVDRYKYDYKNQVELPTGDNTLLEKVECLKEYTGVPYQESSEFGPSLKERIDDLNDLAGDGTGITGTLTDNVNNLWAEVGTGGGGNNLSSRVSNLESQVGNESTGGRSLTDVVGGADIGEGKTLTGVVGGTDLGSGNTLTGMASRLDGEVSGLSTTVTNLSGVVGDGDVGEGHSGSLSANVKAINETLDQIKGSVYVFKGNVDSSGINALVAAGMAGELSNGWVWNAASDLSFDYPTENGEHYDFQKGANFAYVKSEGMGGEYGMFDELGSVADVAELNRRVEKLESRFDCTNTPVSSGWTSGDLTGMFLITASVTGLNSATVAFIGVFNGGEIQTPIIKISENFDTYFEIDDGTNKIKSLKTLNSLNVFKLSAV